MGKIGDAWGAEPDLENRDPNNLNDHLKVSFEEVLGEPDHTHSMDCVWKYSAKCFNLWKALCYILSTLFCGIPMAMCWGCEFAGIAFTHIWELTPAYRACEIQVFMITRWYSLIIHSLCDPCCEAFGKIFDAFRK